MQKEVEMIISNVSSGTGFTPTETAQRTDRKPKTSTERDSAVARRTEQGSTSGGQALASLQTPPPPPPPRPPDPAQQTQGSTANKQSQVTGRILDKKDTNQDGQVSSQEELQYSLKSSTGSSSTYTQQGKSTQTGTASGSLVNIFG